MRWPLKTKYSGGAFDSIVPGGADDVRGGDQLDGGGDVFDGAGIAPDCIIALGPAGGV